jgi:hypothetical protein
MCYDVLRNYTVETKDAEILKRKTDYEKQRVTVALCITAVGNKLKL